MNKPLIGITCNSLPADGAGLPARTLANTDYITSIVRAGGVPLLLPPVPGDSACIRRQLLSLDGIVLTGGPDINPLLYGEEPLEKLGIVNHERDEYELELVRTAAELHKPLLGICRGAQMLNVAFGGTLHQDIHFSAGAQIKHFQTSAQREALWHTAIIEPASVLAVILGQSTLMVNSYHHQSVKELASGFIVAARAKDNLIEAIERPGDLFVLGIQWHPEILTKDHPVMLNLFQAFIKASLSKG